MRELVSVDMDGESVAGEVVGVEEAKLQVTAVGGGAIVYAEEDEEAVGSIAGPAVVGTGVRPGPVLFWFAAAYDEDAVLFELAAFVGGAGEVCHAVIGFADLPEVVRRGLLRCCN